MQLLIKFATRGRPEKFIKSMDNICRTIEGDEYQIIISCDIDDLTMNNPEIIQKVSQYKNAEIYFNEPISKVSAINANLDKAKSWSWLVNTSDDMIWLVNGWNNKMQSDIKGQWGTSTDFFAHFNDNHIGDKLSTLHVVGKEYFDRDGVIYDTDYGSICCDAQAFFQAKMRGCYHYFPTVYFTHDHPSNTGASTNHIYLRNDFWGERDIKTYFSKMKRYFDVPKEQIVFIPEQLQKEIDNLK